MKTLKRNDSYWLDEMGDKYKYLKDEGMFFNLTSCEHFKTIDIIDGDELVVEIAQGPKIVEMYMEEYDRTILTEYIFVDGILRSEEIVSWYFGPPTKQTTFDFSRNRKLKAVYEI